MTWTVRSAPPKATRSPAGERHGQRQVGRHLPVVQRLVVARRVPHLDLPELPRRPPGRDQQPAVIGEEDGRRARRPAGDAANQPRPVGVVQQDLVRPGHRDRRAVRRPRQGRHDRKLPVNSRPGRRRGAGGQVALRHGSRAGRRVVLRPLFDPTRQDRHLGVRQPLPLGRHGRLGAGNLVDDQALARLPRHERRPGLAAGVEGRVGRQVELPLQLPGLVAGHATAGKDRPNVGVEADGLVPRLLRRGWRLLFTERKGGEEREDGERPQQGEGVVRHVRHA